MQQPSPYQLPPQQPGMPYPTPPRKSNKLLIVFGILGGLALLCILGVGALVVLGNSPAVQQAAKERATSEAATSVALVNEETTLQASAEELFNESFDNNDTGFDTTATEGSTVAVGGGSYQATLDENAYRSVYSDDQVSSFISEVDCKVAQGGNNGVCGIIFGVHEIEGKEETEKMFFFVTGNSYGVATQTGNINTNKEFSNKAVKDEEGAVNTLRVVRVGDEARLYVNAQLVDRVQVTEEKLKSGGVGFSVGAEDGNAVVEVDNWKVYKVE